MINMKGTIRFDSIPDKVDIYIDNEYIGQTPIDITDITPGTYSYSIKKDEENQFSSELQVYQDKITHIVSDFNTKSIFKEYIDIINEESSLSKGYHDNNKPFKKEISALSCVPPIPNLEVSSEPSTKITTDETTTDETTTDETTTDETTSSPEPESVPTIDQTMIDLLTSIKDSLNAINKNIGKTMPIETIGIYDKSSFITTSVPNDPNDPTSSLYQMENIHDVLMANANTIHIYNDGPGLLFAVSSIDGKNFSKETVIYDGEIKDYNDVYTVGLRSPTQGLKYRLTERQLTNQSSQQFTGSRFRDRRDRKGAIVYYDDMESPTIKYNAVTANLGTVLRSSTGAYQGDFSTHSVLTGAPADRAAFMYVHTDFHVSKIGAQIRFSSSLATTSQILLQMLFVDGTNVHTGAITIDGTGIARILNPDGTTTVIATNIIISKILGPWNTIKLVIDPTSDSYVSTNLNGISINLSAFNLTVMPLITTFDNGFVVSGISCKCLRNYIGLIGGATTVFFDDYIFTEDEDKL